VETPPGFFSALSCRHGEELSRFLFHMSAATIRARQLFRIVLGQGENLLKWLVAILADVVIDRHGNPPTELHVIEATPQWQLQLRNR
jgi:hypothetical protein